MTSEQNFENRRPLPKGNIYWLWLVVCMSLSSVCYRKINKPFIELSCGYYCMGSCDKRI